MFLTTLFLAIAILLAGIFNLVVYAPIAPLPSISTLLPSAPRSRAAVPRALVLTAHPDDEAMFFGPVILGLVEQGVEVWGMCMSTGDANGLGETRRTELLASYNHLGIPTTQIRWVEHPDLLDGPELWSAQLLAETVAEFLEDEKMDLLITFDHHGISSHPNHRSLPTLLPLLPTLLPRSHLPTPYLLHTLPLPSKYLGPLPATYAAWSKWINELAEPWLVGLLEANPFPELKSTSEGILSELAARSGPTDIKFTVDWRGYQRISEAMREHKTQLEWFRWGWIAASRYMWEGELRAVGFGGEEVGSGGSGRDEL